MRRIPAHAHSLKPVEPLIDPETGIYLGIQASEIKVEAIFLDILQCSMMTFAQRLAEARGCGVVQMEMCMPREQQQQQLRAKGPGSATPRKFRVSKPQLPGAAGTSSCAGPVSTLQPALCSGIPAPLVRSRVPRRLPTQPLMAADSLPRPAL